jgi:dTDP-4-amino-4,6-dideoxygalactose transaminase
MRARQTIGQDEVDAVYEFMTDVSKGSRILSGYLAGCVGGGLHVTTLEFKFAELVGRKYAIACNSATSGLLVACRAVFPEKTRIGVPVASMSATAAVPAFLGHNLKWLDVDDHMCAIPKGAEEVIGGAIVTDLFGHPADIGLWRKKMYPSFPIIQDAAQSLLATDNTEERAQVTVYSFNVHKVINAGEGGMITTDDPKLAEAMMYIVNHAEAAGKNYFGLNLRMPELTAVLVLSQLKTIREKVESFRLLDDWLRLSSSDGPLKPLPRRLGTTPSPYCTAFLAKSRGLAEIGARALSRIYLPARVGYGAGPLNRLLAFRTSGRRERGTVCPRAIEMLERLVLVELSPIDPTADEKEQIKEVFHDLGRK